MGAAEDPDGPASFSGKSPPRKRNINSCIPKRLTLLAEPSPKTPSEIA